MTFKFKNLSLAVGLSVGSICAPALAVPITTSVESSVVIDQNGVINSHSDGPGSSAYSYKHEYVGYNRYSSGNANGDDSGRSYLTSESSVNVSTVTSTFHQLAKVTNDAATAQAFTFSFLINQGSLSVYKNYNTTLLGSDFYSASYSADIRVNGVSIWNSAATLTNDATQSNLTQSGTSLGSYWSGNDYYSWSPFAKTLNLGTFASGEEFTLDYFLTTNVTNSILNPGVCDGYGYGCTSRAQFGDPNEIASAMNEDTIKPGVTASVPEPTSLVLLGVGLAGLAFRRRAKKSV